jgi:hypothetical protein
MTDESDRIGAAEAMQRINAAWVGGRVDDLAALIHPDILMVFPGFTGAMQGRDAFLAGFRDFCDNATLHEFREQDSAVDVVGDVAVATFRFDMVYERDGQRSRSTGRDLWVLARRAGTWTAMWRTLIDMQEAPA